MREILFRGKCVDTGAWYEGQYIHLHKTTYCFEGSAKRDAENEIHQIVFERMTDWNLPNRHLRADVIPETVGQYTGLTVPSGKIFEHDIVTAKFKSNGARFNFTVKYSNEHGCYVFDNGCTKVPFCNIRSVRIIGNIHDNPELLKGGE